MNFEKQPVESLHNESDVEQKFVYPLLVADHPSGLGFSDNSVRTKANIRRFTIGKGSDTKSYIPDYIVVEGGVPLVIVEGKRPGSDVEEAFREARLYAAEMNALFPKNVNPVFAIIATDAVRTLVGSPDQATPVIDMSYDDIDVYSEKLRTMVEFCGKPASLTQYAQIVKIMRPAYLWKPRRMVGGSAIQREEVNLNTFGATISADFAPIFNPLTHADRANIAKNGYISSKRRERYIQPIDRVIRAAAPPSETRAKSIDDTSNPKEIYRVLRDRRPLENKIMLLIGSAGSGKTTFVDYLQETALPADIRNRTLWIRVNVNNINIARDEIYNSLRKEIISVCKLMHPSIDFEDLETIKLIHSVEVNAYRKGIGRLFEKDKGAYDNRLADVLIENENNLHTKATNYVRYLSNGGEKLVVYVLDNSDKRLKADQLMMFEAAQWLQKEFRGLVVLPLREETYDNHRSEPPLDTALKDLVFRIEPPLFQKVLQSRVQLALKSIQRKGQKSLRYSLPNGMHVEYAASDQAYYLASIMKSIFEHDHHVRHLIVGLSGRNIRRALEIFLDFCTSGHIGEDEFLKIKQSEGQYVLPLSLVTTILLRVNQRFYSSSHAYLKNICSVSERDEQLHYFSRLVLLRLLEIERGSTGPERLKGYMHVSLLRNKAFLYGINRTTFDNDLESLVKGFCIVTEDFKVECIEDNDLVAIAPAGLIHLEMMSDPYYLAAVSEDTWFDVKKEAELVAERIKDIQQQYKPSTTLYNAQAMVSLLRKSYDKEQAAIKVVSDRDDFSEVIGMDVVEDRVLKYERSLKSGPWLGVNTRYPVSSIHIGKVINRSKYGVFVQMEQGITGLIRLDKLPEDYSTSKQFTKGQAVSVKIERTDLVAEKMELALT